MIIHCGVCVLYVIFSAALNYEIILQHFPRNLQDVCEIVIVASRMLLLLYQRNSADFFCMVVIIAIVVVTCVVCAAE